jgi:hypothetical protein
MYLMKAKKSLVISLVLMVLVSALYRIMPNRPMGFAPQIAIGLFSGAIFVHNKKWAFILPLVSMFLSDLLYELLYLNGMSDIKGFYDGQWVNYLIFISLTCFGFMIKKNRVFSVLAAAIAAPTAHFLVSNFVMVWLVDRGFGLNRPHTFNGLLLTYYDALPFYKNALLATVVFSAVLFGTYYLAQSRLEKKQLA